MNKADAFRMLIDELSEIKMYLPALETLVIGEFLDNELRVFRAYPRESLGCHACCDIRLQ